MCGNTGYVQICRRSCADMFSDGETQGVVWLLLWCDEISVTGKGQVEEILLHRVNGMSVGLEAEGLLLASL